MIFLLDTDIVIYMARGLKAVRKPKQRERALGLVERCREARTVGNSVGLSAVTVSELEFGARNSGHYDAEMEAVRKLLTPFDIYDYDGVFCPPHYGRVRHELEAQGIAIGAMDLLIAAHALALDATLISNNLAHFSRVTALRTVNWVAL